MNRNMFVLSALGIAAVVVSACSSNTAGSPAPATSAPIAPPASNTQSAGAPSSSAANDPLAATDPCTLLDASVISQNQLSSGKSATGPGVRECRWDKSADSSSAGYLVTIGIYDHAGLDDLSTAGFIVSNNPVGSHQGRLSKDTAGHTCDVSLGISKTSRVDIGGVDGAGNLDAACVVATQIAPLVEQKLPAGTG